ncbi:MAG: 16S rRNA (cytidine(1402)-2'-O)-methyltransferase [Desulfobacterales bacterium]|jgi:16S rRNA (cytidine1402-2'-O)-methyltransferase|nr:16S rRNA (cytidine(1402)-2'-O)-methyltransferase [Desulfobacterales bacterium]
MNDMPGRRGAGRLYIVATPIGNLKDITFRAIETLNTVDIIAAEDTRHTRKLLSHFQIKSRLVSCHEHNETFRIPMLLERLQSGLSVALVSDAGTPSVSDPGYRLATAAIAEGIRVVPIPGASAAISALSASGLPSDSFFFAGFLPATSSKRRAKLEELSNIPSTLIFYESPRRFSSSLADMLKVLGDRPAVIAREMTKLHEEFLRGSLSELVRSLAGIESLKGEITLLVGPAFPDPCAADDLLEQHILSELEKRDFTVSSLAKELSKAYKMPKNMIYQKILDIKSAMDNTEDNGKGDH